jgi:hypothetical protein
MTVKVAEAHCLRRAFDICGVYTPEEMPEQGESVMREVPDTSRAAPAFIDRDTAGSPVRCGYCGKELEAHPNERFTNVPGHGWRCLACRAALETAESVEA